MLENIINLVAKNTNIKHKDIQATINLLDEGNTVPFIARYRKDVTNNLDEKEIRLIKSRTEYIRKLEKRKDEVLKKIKKQGKLNKKIQSKIERAEILQEVEDLYRPYKKKRKTRADKAKEKGLEPLAKLIWEQEITNEEKDNYGEKYKNIEFELDILNDVYQGARDIIAEWISDNAEIRRWIRRFFLKQGILFSFCNSKENDTDGKYELYYDYSEKVSLIPSHRILALNRGEKEGVLNIKITVNGKEIIEYIERVIIKRDSLFMEDIELAIEDAFKRLIEPSIIRDIRNKLSEKAEKHAIQIFSKNLRSLLLQAPIFDKIILGIDPGFKSGSKIAVIDKNGKVLDIETIYPHPPLNKKKEAKLIIKGLIDKHDVDIIAIGNGTASRETELFISDFIKESAKLKYVIVSEAGASVYSASKLAAEEFPDLDVSLRGAVSIARRLQDPMSELVKINPRSVGVGLYQHDVNEKKLDDSLKDVIESVVNYVGVDVNTASYSLLQYVSGIDKRIAKNILKMRDIEGDFKKREDLLKVKYLGLKTYTQAAGFLRIYSLKDPFGRTPIHPESYKSTEIFFQELGFKSADLMDNKKFEKIRELLNNVNIEKKASELNIGNHTLNDIIEALKKPGRDPRSDIPKPIFKKDILKFEDLKIDMILEGTIRNVVDFGAFVDIGIKEDGLIHISQLSEKYLKHPLEIVNVGDIIKIKIIDIDERRKRISLSMRF